MDECLDCSQVGTAKDYLGRADGHTLIEHGLPLLLQFDDLQHGAIEQEVAAGKLVASLAAWLHQRTSESEQILAKSEEAVDAYAPPLPSAVLHLLLSLPALLRKPALAVL